MTNLNFVELVIRGGSRASDVRVGTVSHLLCLELVLRSDLSRFLDTETVVVDDLDLFERQAGWLGIAEVDEDQTSLNRVTQRVVSVMIEVAVVDGPLTRQIPAYRAKVGVGPMAFIKVRKVAEMTMLAAQTPPARIEAPIPRISRGNISPTVHVMLPEPVA